MQPPKIPLKFLRWFCKQEQIDEVEGDLIELFELRYSQSGKKANWLFVWDVLRSLRTTNVKKLKLLNMSNGILKNTLTTGIRQMSRNKTFTGINLAGLSLSLIAFFMIALFVFDEVNYDRFHTNYDHIYRVLKTDTLNTYKAGITPPALATKILSDYPEFQKFTRVYQIRQMDIKFQNAELSMKGYIADSSFFEIFSFPSLAGQKTNILHDRNSVVLTKKTAELFFEGDQAVGKTISFNDKEFIVSAIVSNPPPNSHLQFDYILPMKGIWPEQVFDNWDQSFVTTYFLVETQDFDATNQKIGTLLMDNREAYVNTYVQLQPLSEIHLDPKVNFNLTPAGNSFYVQLFILGGIVILIIAGINFMNLNLARATHRVKEVGVRKLIGAQRRTIVKQFVGETLLLIFISLALAIASLFFLLPYFNVLSGKSFTITQLWHSIPKMNTLLIALAVVGNLSILAGLYPALVVSAVAPIHLIKGWVAQRMGNVSVGRILTTLQFAISMMLIICSIVALSQLQYMQTKNLGWDQNNLIQIPLRKGMFESFELFKNDLLLNNSIEEVTWVSELPVDVGTGGIITFEDMNPDKQYSAYYINAGLDFYNTFKIQTMEGYSYPTVINESKSNYVINEALLKVMQEEWGPDVSPIGKELDEGIIVGVVQDFHWQPMTKTIGPILYGLEAKDSYGRPGFMVIRIRDNQLMAGLDVVEKTHQTIFPNRTLHFDFVDDKLSALYQTESQTATLLSYFAGFTIFISCLGLLGLAYHAVSIRIKSLSIRKVLGANLVQLFLQFSREFVFVIALAATIAVPLAYWMMDEWLQSFAYHISMSWHHFLFTILGMFILVLAIVGIQFVKVASLNPARTLRDE